MGVKIFQGWWGTCVSGSRRRRGGRRRSPRPNGGVHRGPALVILREILLTIFLGSFSLHPWTWGETLMGRGGWNLGGGLEPWVPEGNGVWKGWG